MTDAPDLPDRLSADEEHVMFLERDQLVIDKERPVPRANLSAAACVRRHRQRDGDLHVRVAARALTPGGSSATRRR
jgi:hypothetical protein